METGGIIYALLANNMAGLKIIYVSNPQKPVLVNSIISGRLDVGLRTMEIGVKIYALVLDSQNVKIIDVNNP